MTAPDEALRELALAARDSQPRAWDFEEERETDEPAAWFDPDALSSRNVMSEPDSRFIAAANPTAVLALLDERDALRGAVERVLRTADRPTSHSATARVNAAALDDLRATLEGPQ